MKKKIMITAVLLISTLLIIAVIQNKAVGVTDINISSDRIPEAFNGFKIAHVSDLHNEEFGESNERLLTLLKESEPDIIVITGDIMDSRKTDLTVADEFVKNALSIAPVYYVSGNHEARIVEYPAFRENIISYGAVVLSNESAVIERDGETINLLGIDDPAVYSGGKYATSKDDEAATIQSAIESIKGEGYNILLSHRPEYFDVYVSSGVDLVFSGHAHGGQFRVPFIGGLYAPNQGIFPEYTAGAYSGGNTTMIVSRGLGNSLFPLRVNNNPEVVIVTLCM